MTTANKITVVRILMIPAFVTMAIYYGESIKRGQPLEWQRFAAIAIFLVAALSDGLDGYVARRYNQHSTLGVILDPVADKGLLLSGIIALSLTNWSELGPEDRKIPCLVPGAGHFSRCHSSGRDTHPVFTQRKSERETTLDWKNRDSIADVRHRVGDVAGARSFRCFTLCLLAGAFTLISGIVYVTDGVRQLQAAGHAHPAKS